MPAVYVLLPWKGRNPFWIDLLNAKKVGELGNAIRSECELSANELANLDLRLVCHSGEVLQEEQVEEAFRRASNLLEHPAQLLEEVGVTDECHLIGKLRTQASTGAEEMAGGQARGGAQDVLEPVASNRAVAEQLLAAELCDWPKERTDGPVDELGRFLVSPLPSKLPVLAWHHRVVIATDPCFEQYVRVAGSCPLVTKISSALCEMEVQPGDLESRVTQLVVGYMVLLEHLSVALDHADRLTVRVGIDTSEKIVSDPIVSSSGTRSRRPDVVVTGARLTLLVGEHKRSRSLGDAWDRLKEYLRNGFPALFYGPVPYLLCFAAAGSEFQFGTVSQDGKVTCIGQPLNASLLSDRLKICNAVINSYRIFKLLVKQAPPEEHRVELHKRIERSPIPQWWYAQLSRP